MQSRCETCGPVQPEQKREHPVVNASFGGGGYSQAQADAINALGQSGILFVAAAGNDSSDTDVHPHYLPTIRFRTLSL